MGILKLTDDNISDIITMYEAGVPICSIAYKYGVSKGTICNRMRRAGVRMRSENNNHPGQVRSSMPEIMSLAANIEMPTMRRLLIDPSTRVTV